LRCFASEIRCQQRRVTCILHLKWRLNRHRNSDAIKLRHSRWQTYSVAESHATQPRPPAMILHVSSKPTRKWRQFRRWPRMRCTIRCAMAATVFTGRKCYNDIRHVSRSKNVSQLSSWFEWEISERQSVQSNRQTNAWNASQNHCVLEYNAYN